jgi:hypothetical protein|tara:strand:+ start:114 stop:269 length:156 start_codon:yes stop_codon:yes gene_type:complete
MNKQARRELKAELLLLGWSIAKAMLFCAFVLAFSWSTVAVLATFQIIKVTG